MHDTISSLVSQLQSGSEVFEEKLSSSRDQMQEQLVTSLQAMNQHIARQASSASEEWQGQIRSTIAKGAQQTTDELQSAVQHMSDQLKVPVQEVQSGLIAWVEQTREVTGSLKAINTTLGAHRDGINTSTVKLVEASGAMQSASSAVRDTTMPMRDAAIAAKTVSEQLLMISRTTADKVSHFSDQVGDSVTETKNILQTLQQTWNSQSKHLENADVELADAFKTITSNLGDSLGQLSKFNENMEISMAKSVEGLTAMIEELSESVVGLQERR